MHFFEASTTFLDHRALNIQGEKAKYFIGMNNADESDDIVVSFVFNTERRMDLYHLGCNKKAEKYIIPPNSLSFISDYSSIMLAVPTYYKLKDIIESYTANIFEKPDMKILREIKNCIDTNNIPLKFQHLIKESFK
ncbi:hypothetical protein C4588_03185 [Candidatus Parcubacteria bacterium]|jgi:hypothetical protein|nr:MAG: hypothetical protein C4588_03185 [Candidatus Parcubacteria bacterium]